MSFNKIIGVGGGFPVADTSALAAIHDSVGKFGRDQLNRAIDDGKRCVEQAEQTKAFPGHGVSCQGTQRICLYCAQKLVLQHWLVPLSLCPVVRTKFPNRVIHSCTLAAGLCLLLINSNVMIREQFPGYYFGKRSRLPEIGGSRFQEPCPL